MSEKENLICASETEIKDLFTKTKTIAIIGLSPDPTKDSNKVARYLQKVGYKIYPVYPKGEEILNEKVYRNLSEIDQPVDMVDVFRKAEFIAKVVDEVLARDDVKCVWTQLDLVNNEAARRAQAAGIAVVQDRCTKIEHQRMFPFA
ncbi:MAG: CoA-binding protein [Deltaproteobacteria bacterium]|nr:CoA-binding protein [Deltaproteobacteria bacterium]